MSDPFEVVTDESFGPQVESSPMPFLVEFTSPWCTACAALEPVLAEVAAEHAGRLRVGQLNIGDHPATPERFGVRTTPTVLVFRDGRPVRRLMGAKNKRNLLEALREHVD